MDELLRELFIFDELITDAIAGLICAALCYRFSALHEKLADCKTSVKVGMFISSVLLLTVFVALARVSKALPDGGASGNDEAVSYLMGFALVFVIFAVLGSIAIDRIWGKLGLKYKKRYVLGYIYSLFLIPWWLFFWKKDQTDSSK